MNRGTIKLLDDRVNSFVFYIHIFISSDIDKKSLANTFATYTALFPSGQLITTEQGKIAVFSS